MGKFCFASDYQEGMHPEILKVICDTNLTQAPGYGTDAWCTSAREKIRAACACPRAGVHFLLGGTQANAVVIDSLLRSYQGVIAADTGHISCHEAGAIEHGGHKVLTLPHRNGKLSADRIRSCCEAYFRDENRDHMVMPGMVYLSQPTEYGTLYSLEELTDISGVCRSYGIPLYVDGARLAYALACPENTVGLPDLARLCDAFYIGGTKCGAMFGEAVVLPNPDLIPHFFSIIKQHGALLAKGRLLGIQFHTLFSDDLYTRVGEPAIRTAGMLREVFRANHIPFAFETPTNQIFVVLGNEQMNEMAELADFSYWEPWDENHTVVRFATSWATREEDVSGFADLLAHRPSAGR